MTEEARKTAKAMHQNECEDCVFNPTRLGCRWRKEGTYCDTGLHSAADLIESLSARLEQVEQERDGLNIMLAQAQAMLETRTKERDAAVRDLEIHKFCHLCAEDAVADSEKCYTCSNKCYWQWRGVREESE